MTTKNELLRILNVRPCFRSVSGAHTWVSGDRDWSFPTHGRLILSQGMAWALSSHEFMLYVFKLNICFDWQLQFIYRQKSINICLTNTKHYQRY